MTDKEALDFLAYKMGRNVRVAEALGITPQALSHWRKRKRGISADKRPTVWVMVNDHGGSLPVEWLMERSAA